MPTKTIGQLDEIVSAAATDLLEIEQISSGLSKRITKANLVGGAMSGGGTIATGGHNLTVSGPSTINGSLVGNVSGGGTIATGGFTLTVGATSTINGSLVGNITGGGTIATGGFTLTVPATGTASLLALAQTYSALKTFSAGLSFGADPLSAYSEGTWLPIFYGAGGNPTVAFSARSGIYRVLNKICFFQATVTISTISGGSGLLSLSLPFAATGAFSQQTGSFWWIDAGVAAHSGALQIIGGTSAAAFIDGVIAGNMSVSHISALDSIAMAGWYLIA